MTERKKLILEDLQRLMQIHNIHFEYVTTTEKSGVMFVVDGEDTVYNNQINHKNIKEYLEKIM